MICKRGNNVEIVQAKCWSATKTIHEKHVFQLYGTTLLYRIQNPSHVVHPVLAVTTDLSEVALAAARELGVRVEMITLDLNYPMIKCNINQTTGDQIYHLPFDQQYDRTKIDKRRGECYVETIAKAEERGFMNQNDITLTLIPYLKRYLWVATVHFPTKKTGHNRLPTTKIVSPRDKEVLFRGGDHPYNPTLRY